MTSDPAGAVNGNEVAETLIDKAESSRRSTGDSTTPTVQTVVNQDHWYYYHVSTP